jgi:hypothetical protein
MTFPYLFVLYPKLIHPFHFSLFHFSPLLMVISTSLNVLYSFLHGKYINHIHLVYFLLLPPSPISALPVV